MLATILRCIFISAEAFESEAFFNVKNILYYFHHSNILANIVASKTNARQNHMKNKSTDSAPARISIKAKYMNA